MSDVRGLRVGSLLLWLVFIVALLLFVLSIVGVGFSIPVWTVWLMLAVLAGAMLFPT